MTQPVIDPPRYELKVWAEGVVTVHEGDEIPEQPQDEPTAGTEPEGAKS